MDKIKNTMKIIKTNRGIEVKVYAETFENEAYEQVERLANYEAYADSKIRIMPDSHAGKGCTVGTTITITDKVTPNLVGVDIGCGMLTIELNDKFIDCAKLDDIIRSKVPNGFNVHDRQKETFNFDNLICAKHVNLERALLSIGSLGGGNHFIEMDYSKKTGKYYLVIHTGSRKLGGDVCKYYQNIAFIELNKAKKNKYDLINKLKLEGRTKEINSELKNIVDITVNNELAHLYGDNFNNYLNDMYIVQQFAILNRKTIADIIINEMGFSESFRFETIHNYIDFKRMILRKGAVSAEFGERLLIPINMRDGSLICIGKGNEDWNFSAPHGAGRLMSRSKAKKNISIDDFESSMVGIFTTSVSRATIDEAPQAYKSIEEISLAIKDTVEIVDIIKPIYNFKTND